MRALTVTLAAVGGLAFGSFGNVVVWRVPRKESIVRPGSHCPNCGATLRWYENLPLVSWVVQRARCRHCGEPISARYPAIEALTALLFALAAATLPRRTDLVAYLPLVWVLVVLSFIDLDHKTLPNRIVYPSIVAGAGLLLVSAALGPGPGAWVRAVEAGAAGFAVFFALALISPGGMGMGDVKLSFLLGMSLGYLDHGWHRLFIGFFLAFLSGAVVGLALMLARRAGRKTQIPFGPYLAFGTLISIFWGGPIVRAWLNR